MTYGYSGADPINSSDASGRDIDVWHELFICAYLIAGGCISEQQNSDNHWSTQVSFGWGVGGGPGYTFGVGKDNNNGSVEGCYILCLGGGDSFGSIGLAANKKLWRLIAHGISSANLAPRKGESLQMTEIEMILVGGASLMTGSLSFVLNKVWGDFLHDAFGDAIAQAAGAKSQKSARYPQLLLTSLVIGSVGTALFISGLVREIVG